MLPIDDDNPLCQKPPSPNIEIALRSPPPSNAAFEAGPRPYPIVEPPISNGGKLAKRWQPISPVIWCLPRSFSTSFIAAKIGLSGQPVQKLGGLIGTVSVRSGI